MPKYYLYLVLCVFLVRCSTDSAPDDGPMSLAQAIANEDVFLGNVIACAASNEDPTVVSIFLYPRPSVTNIRFYVSESADINKNDYTNYRLGSAEALPVFNGHLLKFEITPETEKWAIVTFEEEGSVHLSNPIRLKQFTKATEYLPQNISIDFSAPQMPSFTWQDGTFDDTAIYFHVVSDNNDNLFSGTYTFERNFTYYKLDNVVLNVTEEEPPPLEMGNTYRFSLLAVSEDNWVNLFSVVDFDL